MSGSSGYILAESEENVLVHQGVHKPQHITSLQVYHCKYEYAEPYYVILISLAVTIE